MLMGVVLNFDIVGFYFELIWFLWNIVVMGGQSDYCICFGFIYVSFFLVCIDFYFYLFVQEFFFWVCSFVWESWCDVI